MSWSHESSIRGLNAGAAVADTGLPEAGITASGRSADERCTRFGAARCGMRIGNHVIYRGKRYVLRGLEPMGIPDRRADIEDGRTGRLLRVRVADLRPVQGSTG